MYYLFLDFFFCTMIIGSFNIEHLANKFLGSVPLFACIVMSMLLEDHHASLLTTYHTTYSPLDEKTLPEKLLSQHKPGFFLKIFLVFPISVWPSPMIILLILQYHPHLIRTPYCRNMSRHTLIGHPAARLETIVLVNKMYVLVENVGNQ